MKDIFLLLFTFSLLTTCSKQNDNGLEYVDTVVIGGGLMGSATAWQLSRQGNEVLLLEKQDSIYTQGSSYGVARIARSLSLIHI